MTGEDSGWRSRSACWHAPPRAYRASRSAPDRFQTEPVTVSGMHRLADAVDSIAAAESGFSGVVRVDRDDEVELAKAYGLAHRGHEIPNTVDTQFAIASGAKGLTASRS